MALPDIFKKLAGAIAPMAPTLATMLGGPFAGMAVSALENAFGVSSGSSSADDITKVIQTGSMTPDIVAAVRKADQQHAETMGQQGIDLQKINAAHAEAFMQAQVADTDSARKREMTVRGLTTPALAWLVVGASVALGAAAVTGWVTSDPKQAVLVGTVIGYMFGEAKQVLNYYFGSSFGSEQSTAYLAQSTPTPAAAPTK